MGFTEALSAGFNNVSNFEGRASRAAFWWFILGVWIIEFVVYILTSAIFHGFFGTLVSFVIWVVAWLALLAVGVRRLHDVGQTGWLILLWLVPCIGLVLIYFWVLPSQGDNQYGPPPAA